MEYFSKKAKYLSSTTSYVIIIALLLASLLWTNYKTSKALDSISSNVEVVYVAIDPDGQWSIHWGSEKERDFKNINAVKAGLINWTKSRFELKAHTLSSDYALARMFLSPSLAEDFVSDKGFNSRKVLESHSSCLNCSDRILTVDSSMKFQDSIYDTTGDFVIYKVSFYATLKDRQRANSRPSPKNDERMLIDISYRLMTNDELDSILTNNKAKNGRLTQSVSYWLQNNPLGIEIIDYNKVSL